MNNNPEREEPIIRDKRRIDPETGQVREPAGADRAAGPAGSGPEEAIGSVESDLAAMEGPDIETSLSDAELGFLAGGVDAEQLAASHLQDLKRVTAEYANYRKRTEANRERERERAIGLAVAVLLPVLDDLDRAEKHGDLESDAPFVAIAAKLRAAVEKLGLIPFGKADEPFDPQIHEAVFQQPAAEVDSEVVAEVVETGYRLGEQLLRPAKVVVRVPAA